MGQLLEACPHIRTFVTETAPLQFETMLLAAYETGACQIESLVVDAFSVEPKHTLAFIVTLQDSRSALARKLRKLSLHTTRAAPFGAMELSGFLEVLRQNKTLMALQLTVLSSLWKEFEPQLMSFDGELVPVEKQPLPVRCRLAFLSAMRVHGSSWNENVASKPERESRSIRVVKMPTHLDEEAEYEDHLENAGDFS
uniref:Uncharacterized protein n=1 Tax=Globisporangium ultimum (strain ATCC 200006 / CBS 805.95 / DAOM BR144) TaxID=431595 RepID=K3WVG3_GLOUD